MTTATRPADDHATAAHGSDQARRLAYAERVAAHTSFSRRELDEWTLAALPAAVRHAHHNSAFYAARLPAKVVAAVTRRDLDAFAALPFTTRSDLADAYPHGLLAAPSEDVVRFDESSGTGNGKPIAAAFTLEDWLINNLTVAALISRVVCSECVAIAVPYELAGVGQDLDRAFEILGCTIVPLGSASPTCPPERMVLALLESKATTLVCSGTRALYLGEIARRLGIDPKVDLAVDKILMAGEGASPAKRRKLTQVWGARPYSMFGMTETNTLALFCPEAHLHLVETRNFFEVVDSDTGARLGDGETGELTVTTLESRANPLIRYRTGDACQIISEPCPCGSPLRRLQHRGRGGDRIAIGPRSASQLEIEDVILDNLVDPPFYFSFATRGETMEISLPAESLANTEVTDGIAKDLDQRFGVPGRFTRLDVDRFESVLRSSAKPTMRNFAPTEGAAS